MEEDRGRRGGGVARSAAEDGVRHHQARARFFSKVGDADRGAQPRRRRGGGVAPLASLSISESHREVCIPSSSAAVEGTAGETSPPRLRRSVGGVASLATRVDAALALLVHGSSFVGDSRAPTNSTAVSTTCSPASSIVCCTEGEGVSHCCFVGISVTQLLDVVDELVVPSGAPRQVNSSELI